MSIFNQTLLMCSYRG